MWNGPGRRRAQASAARAADARAWLVPRPALVLEQQRGVPVAPPAPDHLVDRVDGVHGVGGVHGLVGPNHGRSGSVTRHRGRAC